MILKFLYVWGLVFSVHGIKSGMLPNIYLLFSGRFYQVLNLNFLCQFITGSIPFTFAVNVVYYSTNLWKHLLLASTICLIFTIFPWTKASFSSINPLDMFGFSHIKKENVVEFSFKFE